MINLLKKYIIINLIVIYYEYFKVKNNRNPEMLVTIIMISMGFHSKIKYILRPLIVLVSLGNNITLYKSFNI